MKENYKEYSHGLPDTTDRCGGLLIEHRCICGKLLFKGIMLVSIVEIKCKRCGAVRVFKNNMEGTRSFMLVVDGDGRIVDACEGVAALERSRQYVIGKLLPDILPLARDADIQALLPSSNESKSYQIKNNTLLLRDRKVPLESHVVPIENGSLYPYTNSIGVGVYRIFNICRM